MSTAFLSSGALTYALQAVLASGGARESFLLYHDGGGTVQLGPAGVRRLSGDWGAGLDEWLPLSGVPLPLLHAGQTVGLLWTAPGETLAAPAAEALADLLARVSAAPDPWSADQLAGYSALIDRDGRLRAATPAWLSLFGLAGEAIGQPLGDLRTEWRLLEQALPGVLAGRAFTVPAGWAAMPAGAPAQFGSELRPWPVAGSELAVLFSIWEANAALRVAASPTAAAPTPGLDSTVFRALFDSAAHAQWLVTGKGTVVEVNAAAAALEAGDSAVSMLGELVWSVGVWRGHEAVRRQVRAAALRAGRGEAAETVLELETGPPWQLRARPLTAGHALLELAPLSHEPRDLERRLALLDILLAYSSEGVVVTDARGRPLMLSGTVRKMMMPGAQDSAARDWARHFELRSVGGEVLEPAQFPGTRALRGEEVRDEEVLVVSEQGSRPMSMSAYVLPGDLGVAVLTRDLSEKRRLLSYLSQVTRRDPLTELPNRQAFMDRIETALEERRHDPECRYAVLLCELGNLDDLSARIGPNLSHRLWLDCAARFRDVFRGSDLVARFEQGQFAALLARPGGPAGLDRILDRLRGSFSAPFTVGEETFVPELRVGLVPDLGAQPSAQAVLFAAAQAIRALPERVPAGD
jgi:GGDEF domain-containing protein